MTKDTEERYQVGRAIEVADSRTDIVTGEGVGLVLPTVSLGTRIMSAVIDTTLYTVVTGLAIYLTLRVWEPSNAAQIITWLTTYLMVWAVLIPFAVQYATKGSSLGRVMTGSRTVRYDGGTIGMRHALTRSVAGLFDIHLSLGVLGISSILLTSKGQRSGDLLAGTIVVSWPRRYRGPEPHSVDPSLDRWAQVATISPVPGHLSIASRDFLRSAKPMTEDARISRARDLAAGLEMFVAPPPPRGTNPEAFIATVLAVREAADYEREAQAMVRQMKTEERLTTLPYSVR